MDEHVSEMADSGLTIGHVSTRVVVVPLGRPVIADIGRFDQWPLVLVDIETTNGVVGSSYIAPYRQSAVRGIVAEISDLVDNVVFRGSSPIDVFDSAAKATNVVGTAGMSRIAASALDMALWDALAKHADLPLAVLLGGSVGPVRAYNSNGLWRHDPTTLQAEAADLLADGGFTAVKLRLGNEHLEDDIYAISAVRGATEAHLDLMVDFNQALGFGDAVRRCHELDDQGLYWFEEPIAYDNLSGYAQLARHVKTPLQLGENHYGPRDLWNLAAAGGVHYAMGDLMRIGGVTGWLRTAGVAAAAGIQYSNHLYPEFAAHLLRVTPSAHWLEWVDWAHPILDNPVLPVDGHLTAPNLAGAGLVWDEPAIRKYSVSV
ncbi:enolase C-terminal domain-like protein [Mycolicibacterium peregrinum]|uniref:enolase C-terminal domain-like protein n=1 Tax=Mycolicibacterium peregrinum TaxID=43304 RepID=UPI001AD81361|nr:enolase C-terminal domain-like protein [Mycolicibacterium peregrinum]